jgi:hypothetical protein
MAIFDREFTYRQRIQVSTDDLAAAKAGRRTCTIRLGIAHVAAETIDLTDGADTLNVRIKSVTTERFRNLSNEHANWEGFATVEELRRDLEGYYPRMDPDQPLTIVRFERLSGQ